MNKRPPQTALPKPVRRSFYLVLCALPFLLILALEALLRLSGFGSSYPLFVPAPAPGYLQPNPLLVQRYVNDPRQAPPVAPDSQYFLAEKPQGALRLVVAGESTAAGFPYGRFGSPAALLQQRLKLQSAEQPIEVISTAMAAINSYTVLDLMPELLAIQPDAILLYVGHNEYVGLLGVGSQFQASPNRQLTLWWLQLKQWRLYQWIQRGMQAILPPQADLAGQEATHPQGNIQDQTQGHIQNKSQDKSQGKTTMAQLASQSGITLGSDTYQAGVQQFRDNLAAIAEIAQEAGVPLIVTSLVSNEKALPPFLTVQSQAASAVEPDLAAADLSQHLAQNLAQNLAQYPALLKTAHEDALLHYQYGQALLQNRQPEAALQAFQHAKDLDLLRFRAPTPFNQQLRELSQAPGVWLADAETLFRQHSSDGILGAELLLEHVHPNEQGYQLIADSWWRTLQRAGVLPKVPDQTAAAAPAALLSVLDQTNARYKIALLLADQPFDQQQQIPTPQLTSFSNAMAHSELRQLAQQLLKGGDWLKLHQQLLAFYQQQRDAPNAAKVAALLSDALPFQAEIAFAAGQFYFLAEDLPMTLFYQWRAVQLAPTNGQYRLMLARTQTAQGDFAAALQQLDLLLQQQPDHQIALQQQRRLKAALAADAAKQAAAKKDTAETGTALQDATKQEAALPGISGSDGARP